MKRHLAQSTELLRSKAGGLPGLHRPATIRRSLLLGQGLRPRPVAGGDAAVGAADDKGVAHVDRDVLGNGRHRRRHPRILKAKSRLELIVRTGLPHKPDVHDLQDIVIGRVPSRQVAGGAATAMLVPVAPFRLMALPVNPLALCMIWMPWIW